MLPHTQGSRTRAVRVEQTCSYSSVLSSLWGSCVPTEMLYLYSIKGTTSKNCCPAGRARLQMLLENQTPSSGGFCQINRLAIRKNKLEEVVLKQETSFKRPEGPETLRRTISNVILRFFNIQNKCSFLLATGHPK